MNRPSRRRSVGVVAAALWSIAVAAACGAGDTTVTSGSAADVNVWSSVPRDLALDDRRLNADSGRQSRYQARETLIGRCMADLGFTYVSIGRWDAVPEHRPYGLVDPVAARSRGYEQARSYVEAARASADIRNGLEATFRTNGAEYKAAYLEALNGPPGSAIDIRTEVVSISVPTQGCTAEAERVLFDGAAEAFHRADVERTELDVRARRLSSESPEVRAAIYNWATCMSNRGLPEFTHPIEIGRSFGEATRTRALSQIEVAIADTDCKAETALISTWYASDKKYAEQLASEHRAVLEEYERLAAVELTNASRIA